MSGWSVRAKLLTFALAVITPVTLVAYLAAQDYVAATRAQVLSSSSATTSVAVASVDDFVNTAERLLLVLAATGAIQSSDPSATRDLFAQTLAVSPEYVSLYVLDDGNHVQVSVPGEPNPDNMRYGIDALNRARTAISGRLDKAGRLTAALAVPIQRQGRVSGALGVAYWMALRFTRPLQRVKDTALAIAAGDYAERVPQAQLPHDEVGQLALAFNQMAEALQQHMRRLMDAQAEIEQKARDLQGLLDRSVRVQEDERRRIAQEIHDGVTQMLVGSIYEMQAAKQALGNGAGADNLSVRKLNEALALASDSV